MVDEDVIALATSLGIQHNPNVDILDLMEAVQNEMAPGD